MRYISEDYLFELIEDNEDLEDEGFSSLEISTIKQWIVDLIERIPDKETVEVE